MMPNERENLIRFIQNHEENKSSENISALSDAELRQRAQIITSAQAVKKKTQPDQQRKESRKTDK